MKIKAWPKICKKMLAIIDDMFDPKRLIIWSIHVNTHIVPFMWLVSSWTLNDTISFCICIWTFLNEGTSFLIFTSLHSLVDFYFQRTRSKIGMYEISRYLDVKPNTYCWNEIFMQGSYYTWIYHLKLGFMLLNIVFKYTSVFLIWSST